MQRPSVPGFANTMSHVGLSRLQNMVDAEDLPSPNRGEFDRDGRRPGTSQQLSRLRGMLSTRSDAGPRSRPRTVGAVGSSRPLTTASSSRGAAPRTVSRTGSSYDFAKTSVDVSSLSDNRSRLRSGAGEMKLYTVREPNVRKNSKSFRSNSVMLEVELSERLREYELSNEATGTDSKRHFIQIFRELFDEIIERDEVFGQLLKKIKGAYEANSVSSDQSGLKKAYDDLLLEYAKVRSDCAREIAEKEKHQRQASNLRSENAALRDALEMKSEELYRLGSRFSKNDEVFLAQEILSEKINQIVDDTEHQPRHHEPQSKAAGFRQRDLASTEAQINALENELNVLRLKERQAMTQLRQLRKSVASPASISSYQKPELHLDSQRSSSEISGGHRRSNDHEGSAASDDNDNSVYDSEFSSTGSSDDSRELMDPVSARDDPAPPEAIPGLNLSRLVGNARTDPECRGSDDELDVPQETPTSQKRPDLYNHYEMAKK